MFTLILLCKVDDAINIRLEETIVMSFRLSVHSQNVLLSSSLLSLRVCATMNRTGVAAFNQMVSIIGLFVSILYRSFGLFFFSFNISFGMLLSRTGIPPFTSSYKRPLYSIRRSKINLWNWHFVSLCLHMFCLLIDIC